MSTDAVVLRRAALVTLAALLGLFFFTTKSDAQNGYTAGLILSRWVALDAPPGWEHRATDVIMREMPGWQRDALGNLILRKGSGSPRRVVACALDRPGFAVTEITDEGYLRLREAGGGRLHPLWNQFHEGQRLRVLTRTGVVPAVAMVKSIHLQRGRGPTPVTTLDDIWVDVGATSRTDVDRLGIQLLDPVVRETLGGWSYDGFVSGHMAGVRVGCASVFTAAGGEVGPGETVFLLTTLRSFGHDGLEAALRSLGRVDQVTLIDQGTAEGTAATASAVSQRTVEKPPYLPESTGLTSITVLSPRVRFAGSLVESVDTRDAQTLLQEIEKAAGVTKPKRWQHPFPWLLLREASGDSPRTDQFSPIARILKKLADAYSVSGHELNAREAVIEALPQWARAQARTDTEGNLIVEAGPDRDPVIFIAHLDEVGFEITNIAADGMVSLRPRGGLFPSLWEGQPAIIHIDPSDGQGRRQVHGIFVPRDSATTKQPETLTAWFGVDAAALKQLGVVNGLPVTAAKEATRLGPARFTARGLDDRAGSTALVLAAWRMDPSALKRKVILSWSVREETGLEGAIAMGKRYGASVKRVFSVDTLVSSDSPLETTRFAHARLGHGAVIRGLDNASVAPPAELDRILGIAKANNIPLQVGATNGGTDGSDFIRYGVLHVGLSWPGRYSHSPVEVLDLRDLQALEKLVYAIVTAP
jgi:putative aminopeptidase FrvX